MNQHTKSPIKAIPSSKGFHSQFVITIITSQPPPHVDNQTYLPPSHRGPWTSPFPCHLLYPFLISQFLFSIVSEFWCRVESWSRDLCIFMVSELVLKKVGIVKKLALEKSWYRSQFLVGLRKTNSRKSL